MPDPFATTPCIATPQFPQSLLIGIYNAIAYTIDGGEETEEREGEKGEEN
jgi:hypothetical protein